MLLSLHFISKIYVIIICLKVIGGTGGSIKFDLIRLRRFTLQRNESTSFIKVKVPKKVVKLQQQKKYPPCPCLEPFDTLILTTDATAFI